MVSIGIDPETALAMVITQHAIQYLVVGVPGGLSMLTWKQEISQIDKDREEQDNGSPDAASPAVSSDVSALEQSQV